ncbi:MAG: apolipoprotein N-acyltransferase [Deltaproteobacteria bacterium]|nr:apolipoprotein N-acyltransferase [Deltaproteobacteria bacterium]
MSPSPRALPPWPLLAILSGLLLGFSQPIVIESLTGKTPLDASGLTGLLAFVGLVPALVAIDRAGPKRAYAVGFVTWLVAFSLIIQWLITTIHGYGGLPMVVALPVLLLLTSAIGAYVAAAFSVSRIIARFFGWPLWMVFAPALSGVELLRNFGPVGGFPWGSIGHSFATVPVFLQAASVVGLTGLTFGAGLVNAGLASVVSSWWRREKIDRRAVVVVVVTLLVWGGFGAIRLQDDVLGGPSVKVALMQPNVNEGLADLAREPKSAILDRFHRLEKEALDQGADVVLWPEGSFPNRGLNRDLKEFPDTKNVKLVPEGTVPPQASVVGIVTIGRVKGDDGKLHGVRHNSAFVVDKELNIHGRFDKTHLVPFGEYVPWPFGAVVRQFIPLGTTTPGTHLNPIAIDVDGVPMQIGITVCYEGVFPEVSRTLVNNGATFMANLTDDRWYGVSGMATQHLLMYALRAVETGRPVARATNTGLSAWIDIHGGVHQKTALYEEALVVDDVPLKTIDTLYLKVGDWVALLSLLFTLGCWIAAQLGGRDVLTRPKGPATSTLAALGIVAILAGLIMWLTSDKLDEAVATKAMLLTLSGLLVSIGALSHRTWGRRAIMVVGGLCVFFGAIAAFLSGPGKLVVVVAGGLLVFLAKKHEASRAPPPPEGKA